MCIQSLQWRSDALAEGACSVRVCCCMVLSHLIGELRYGPLGRGLGAHASCDWLVAICAQNAKIVRPESKFVENS